MENGAAVGANTADKLEPVDGAGSQHSSISGGRRKKKGGWLTFPFIAGGMFGVTIAQTGVTMNLSVYLIRRFHMKSIEAAQVFNIVNGCIFAAPVAGAVIADSWFGCIPVVLVSTVVSLLGFIMFTLSAAVESLRPNPCDNSGSGTCSPASSTQYAILFTAVSLISLGATGTRFNIATLGADQLDTPHQHGVFFNWFFCLMYVAAIVGATVIVYVQDSISWGLGFGLCAAVTAVSMVSLVSGLKYYRRIKPNGSPFTAIARVVVAAFRKARITVANEGVKYYSGPMERKDSGFRMPSQTFRFLNKAAVVVEGADETYPDGSVARPWRLCTVAQVEDLKDILRVIPIWSTCIFVSVSVGVQLSLSVLQALTVDRSMGHHFSVPAGSISVASFSAFAISLPILDRVIYPLCSRYLGFDPTSFQRIGVGQALSAVGIAATGVVERHRLDTFQSHGLSGPGGVVPASVSWLILPLAIVGLGEALYLPGQISVYYNEFPEGLKTMGTAMMALIVALGFYLASALVGLFRRTTTWLPDDINSGRMDLVYWTVAGACVVNFVLYLICAKIYTSRSNREKLEKSDQRNPDMVP